MFPRLFRRLPASFRSFAVASAMALFACLSVTGAGMASTGPSPDISDEPPHLPAVELQLSADCREAKRTYRREEQWISDHFFGDVPLEVREKHEAVMDEAWYVAEVKCGIDVDQDGQIG
jgi:hypothetical protein